MEATALVAIVLSNGQGKPPDWEDFCSIILLLLIDSSSGFYEKHNAGNAVKALMHSLTPKAKVKHDSNWAKIDTSDVPAPASGQKPGQAGPKQGRPAALA